MFKTFFCEKKNWGALATNASRGYGPVSARDENRTGLKFV